MGPTIPGERLHILAYKVVAPRPPAVTEISGPTAARFGRTPDEIQGDPDGFAKLVHPDDQARVLAEHADAAVAARALISQYRLLTSNGARIAIRDEAAPMATQEGVSELHGHCLDATLLERNQAERQESEEHLRAVVANIPGVVYRCGCDPNWTIFFMSDHMRILTGYPASDFIGNRVRTYGSIIHRDDRPMVIREIDEALARGSDYSLEYRLMHADGRPRWIAEHGRAVLDAKGNRLWLDGVLLDISRQKSAEESRDQAVEQLRRQALADSLTGLPNRTAFHEHTVQAIADAHRENTELAVLMMDLDRFKDINDTMGHLAGDCVLIEVARRLQVCFREGDTIARWGGDEFAVLLRKASMAAVMSVVDRIRATIERPVECDGKMVSVGASIGIAQLPRDGDDVMTLLQHADIAMYAAKASHAGHAFYDAATDATHAR